MLRKMCFPTILVLALASCQSGIKTAPVDLDASKTAVTELLDKQAASMENRDAAMYLSFYTDDLLLCGTDSKEFWNFQDVKKMYTDMLADTSMKVVFKPSKREIRITKDGNTAVVIEQLFIDPISTRIPVRRICHLAKTDAGWKIDMDAVSMVPNNEDLAKLNKALE